MLLASHVKPSHQVSLKLLLVLCSLLLLLLVIQAALDVHESIILIALHLIDLLFLLFNLVLIMLYFLHHRRTHFVQLIHGCIVLLLDSFLLLLIFHGLAQIGLEILLDAFTLLILLEHVQALFYHVHSQLLLVLLNLNFPLLLLVALLDLLLCVVDPPELHCSVASFLGDILLFFLLLVSLVLLNHVPQCHPVVWIHCVCQFLLSLTRKAFLSR